MLAPISSTVIQSHSVVQKSTASSLLSLPIEVREEVERHLQPQDRQSFFKALTTVTRDGEPLDSPVLKLHLLQQRIESKYHQTLSRSDASLQAFVLNQLRVLSESGQFAQVVESPLFFKLLLLIGDRALFGFLKERIEQEPALKQQLLNWVERSKTEEVQPIAANALTLLVKAGVALTAEQDFNGIRVPGADLSGGIFDCNQFEGADLSHVNFYGAWLRGANFRKANLTGVNFGELPSLEVDGEIDTCFYSPNGRWLAVGTVDGQIKLYQMDTLELVHTFEWSRGTGLVAFSPDSKVLASGGYDGEVRLWRVENKEEWHTLEGHDDMIFSVCFSPDGEFLASGCYEGALKLWRVGSAEEWQTLEGHEGSVSSIDFSPAGEILASGSEDGTVKLWQVSSGEKGHTLKAHTREVMSVSFSPNGKILASGSADNTVNLWRVNNGEKLHTLRHGKWVECVSFSPDGEVLASGGRDYTVRLWGVESGEALHTLEGYSGSITSLNFSPDGEIMASASTSVKLWKMACRQGSRTLEEAYLLLKNVNFSPDGELVAAGSEDGRLKLWRVESGEVLHTLVDDNHQEVSAVSFSPDSKVLASCGWNDAVLWSVASGEVLHRLKGHSSRVYRVSFSPDGKVLASGSWDKAVKLWSVESGKELHTLQGHSAGVQSVNFSPDGKILASGSFDKTVRLWRVARGEELHTLDGHSTAVKSVDFSPDGELLAASDANTIKLWGVESAEELYTFKGHSGVHRVKFSPDGEFLAASNIDKTVNLWSVDTGECKTTLTGFVAPIESVMWQEFPQKNLKMASWRGNAVHIWHIESTDNDWKVSLDWTSYQNELTIDYMSIQDAWGLSAMNQRLLKQRGASGEAAASLRGRQTIVPLKRNFSNLTA